MCFKKFNMLWIVLVSIYLLTPFFVAQAQPKDQPPEVFKKEIIPLLDKYCYRCHDDKKQKGDIRLDIYKDAKQILPNRKHWLLVLEQLETREMPTKKPLPTEAEYEKLIHFVEKAANDIDWEKVKQPGHVTIPLLTKDEYYNTLNDLLGLDLRSHSTFSEDSEGVSGFTNDRDGLFVSTSKMEKYIQTAEAAIDSVLAVNKGSKSWKLESEKMFMTETRETPKKLGNDFLGYVLNRGQMSLYESIDVPADGLYEVSVRAKPSGAISATTLRVDNELRFQIDTDSQDAKVYKRLVKLSKGSRQFTWNIGSNAKAKELEEQGKPLDTNALKQASARAQKQLYQLPPELIAAAKKKKIKLNKLQNAIKNLQVSLEELKVIGTEGKVKEIIKRKSTFGKNSSNLTKSLKDLDKKLKIKSLAQFNKINKEKIAANNKVIKQFAKVKSVKSGPIGIDWMALRGPLPNPAKPILNLKAGSDKEASAKKILSSFLPRAFRKPVSTDDINKYLSLYKSSISKGENFESSIKLALTAVLVSPRFLFRDELKKTDNIFKLDDFQIASRLSYFLWMTMPDNELFSLAIKGQLKNPTVLKAQINRMLNDKRSRRFVAAFAGEWLGFKALGYSVRPDAKKFPQYNTALSDSSKLETVLFMENLFKKNGSLLDLIDAKYTFANQTLANHYQMPEIKGSEMRRVPLSNRMRGGLLGMASILTSTSTPSRTSPVNRGMWIFEKLLGQHMGVPPADVPPLPENAASQKNKTLRQVFEQHRDNPACSNCHDKIDPLGFGLENFDAIGRYRNTENRKKIDASGKMPDGSTFVGVVELKEYILKKKKNEFLRNVSERLLSFALGRQLQYFDEPAIRKIVDAAVKDNFNANTLLSEVIMSYPFLSQSNNTEILGDINE